MKREMRPRQTAIVIGILGSILAMNVGVAPAAEQPTHPSVWAFVGTYTQGDSKGIYAVRFNPNNGKFGQPILAVESENPSFLAIHPSGEYLYAVGETDDYAGSESGFVRGFRINPHTGKLTPLNTQSSGGGAPCHLVVDAQGKTVLVANYSGGSVSSIPIDPEGRLGTPVSLEQHVGSSVNAQRQQEPHAHSINLDQANQFALAADLGLDKVLVYRFDAATGRLSREGAPASATVPPGSGPRHLAFHPSGRVVYVINELASTITVFGYDPANGTLTNRQNISTLPDGYDQPSFTAEVVVHPSGRFVYGSNRGHDSLAVFQVQPDSGELTRLQIEPTQGGAPRNFVIDPSGRFLLAENQGSNTVVVFRIDDQSGRLSATGEILEVPVPVCIRFLVAN